MGVTPCHACGVLLQSGNSGSVKSIEIRPERFKPLGWFELAMVSIMKHLSTSGKLSDTMKHSNRIV